MNVSVNVNVMVIDDDKECLRSLKSALRLNGFNVRGFISPKRAIRHYNPQAVDAVISDYHFPKMKGTEVIKAIHQTKNDAPVIIITGDREKQVETLCFQAGACAFFRKPLDIEQVIATLEGISKK
ncbi:MAG: response regulator [bacterium]|nr:response regulator [bacterium]